MGNATGAKSDWNGWHFTALIGGNVALAIGSWPVRLADTGPVSAGFWRLILAVPLLLLLARANRQPLTGLSTRPWAIMVGAGVFYALDIAADQRRKVPAAPACRPRPLCPRCIPHRHALAAATRLQNEIEE